MQVVQIAHSGFVMFWNGEIVDNANTQGRKKAILYQATTNETCDIGFRFLGRGCIPFFKEGSDSTGSLGNLGNSAQLPLGGSLDIERRQFVHYLVVEQAIDLIEGYAAHVPQIVNAMRIF